MKFKSPERVEEIVWRMKMADLPRGQNRALIDRLFNGLPPLTEQERRAQNAKTNVNFLDAAQIAADARRTYSGAFLKPANFFNVTLDVGPVHKRSEWGRLITTEINRFLKNSKPYFETLRSQFAMTVLHGIGPVYWSDRERWCPAARGIEDVLIPGGTRLSFDNLPHFAVYQQYTPMELIKLTRGPKVDPGWNMDLVKGALDWADEQAQKTLDSAEMYAPEKREERFKEDLGFYGSDAVPTINAWDFYFWSDEGKQSGWRRRMILDTPSTPEAGKMPDKTHTGQAHGQWLYEQKGNKVYAESHEQVIHFQFGDASAVGPFRYHSVRSLGWLLYAVCHLQNRLRCKLNDATFESLMQYFRVSNPEDKERLTKIDLHNYGVVPEGTTFITQQERWKVDQQLAGLTLEMNRGSMDEAASQYREGRDASGTDSEKTATQVMAEVNASNAIIGSMLLQSYVYEGFKLREICRRFCIKHSRDKDVREFRAYCLRKGIPEEVLDSTRWNVEPERVIGNGNKILEVAMADKLQAIRPQLPPESQRKVDHIYVMANSDRPDLADDLVPEVPKITDSMHNAQLMLGTLMAGIQVAPVPGLNPVEVIQTLLVGAANVIKRFTQTGIPDMSEIIGLQTVVGAIEQWIAQLAQDKNAQPIVKQFTGQLKELSNIVQQLSEVVQEKQQAMQQPGAEAGAMEAEAQAKINVIMQTAQAKLESKAAADAQKMEQRQQQFEQKMQMEQQKHDAALDAQLKNSELAALSTGIQTAAKVNAANAKAEEKPSKE